MATLTGGCSCGNVRYQIETAPLWLCHCHCRMCRKHSGSPLATWVGFPAEAVMWLASSPTRYRSSKDVERSFCPICGSSIGFHRVHETYLTVGSLDAPEALPMADLWRAHVWFKDRVPWFDTSDDWTRHAELPPGRAEELSKMSGGEIKG